MAWCGRCGAPVEIPLPVEPLYDAETAAALVPTTKLALLTLLRKNKAELPAPHYRLWKRVRHRLISATEIRWARARLVQRDARSLRGRRKSAPQVPGPVQPTTISPDA